MMDSNIKGNTRLCFIAGIIISLLAVTLLAFAPPHDSQCGCNYLGTAKHKRVKVKDRNPADPAEAKGSTISDMIAMEISAGELADIKASPNTAIEKENKIVTVTGYAWIIKQADDDCDIHIEMSETNSPTAKRMIAEIPNTTKYCSFRSSVLDALVSKYHLSPKKEYHFEKDNSGKPLKLTVTGYLYYDYPHYKKGSKKGHGHGSEHVATLWEIHPVAKLKWYYK